MKTLLLTLLLLLPHAEYKFVAELMAKQALYAHEEYEGRAKIDWLQIHNQLYKIITTDKLSKGEFRLIDNSRTLEYILVDYEIRYIGISAVDTTNEKGTWTKAHFYFSEDGKGVEDKRTIEISSLPLTKADTALMFSLDDRPIRQELDKDYYRTLTKDLNWLTKEIKNYTQQLLSK